MDAADVVSGGGRLIGILAALIQGINSFCLRPGHAAESQFGNQFISGFALCSALLGIFQYLFVSHGTLSPSSAPEEEASDRDYPSLRKYHSK